MKLWSAALFVVFGLVMGCGSKGSVALSASIQKPRIAVEQLTLGARLTGSFDLVLEVGPEASDASTVSLQKFELVRVADGSSLTPLDARPVSHVFPLRVNKGQIVSVPFVLDDSELVEQALRQEVCSGQVRIAGAVTDTLSGGDTTPVSSPAVSTEGC